MVGIYKRKQESEKKERKHALDQESDHENDQEKRKFLDLKISINFTQLQGFH